MTKTIGAMLQGSYRNPQSRAFGGAGTKGLQAQYSNLQGSRFKKKKAKLREGSKAEEAMDAKENMMKRKHKKRKSAMKLTPVSKGHKPNGAHGRAAVKALGRTKTTGNFKKIEAAKGKGAAIAAYQNKLAAHKGEAAPYKRSKKAMSGKELLGKAMKKLKH